MSNDTGMKISKNLSKPPKNFIHTTKISDSVRLKTSDPLKDDNTKKQTASSKILVNPSTEQQEIVVTLEANSLLSAKTIAKEDDKTSASSTVHVLQKIETTQTGQTINSEQKSLSKIHVVKQQPYTSKFTKDVLNEGSLMYATPEKQVDRMQESLKQNVDATVKGMHNQRKSVKAISPMDTKRVTFEEDARIQILLPASHKMEALKSTLTSVTAENGEKLDDKRRMSRLSRVSSRLDEEDWYPNQDDLPDNSMRYDTFTLNDSESIGSVKQELETLHQLPDDVMLSDYIPDGFGNLALEVEEEFMTDFLEEFEYDVAQRKRPKVPISHRTRESSITRSPLELWQKARLAIAIHLFKIQHKTRKQMINDIFSTTKADERATNRITFDEINNFEKLIEQKARLDERCLQYGLVVKQKFCLDFLQQFLCLDVYDVGSGYIFLCDVMCQQMDRVPDKSSSYSTSRNESEKRLEKKSMRYHSTGQKSDHIVEEQQQRPKLLFTPSPQQTNTQQSSISITGLRRETMNCITG
ncbi:unnamed protein product [Didymodactylos carnosus]|uniref:Uncharacterized protein n=1 Tax=Didymodactylos carnosus TaxID=1234261 RepID=A0A814A7J7_9BILA|nr:unnamed protein product [Didymodactylos carnosus]CAF0922099.1 unnamed protein product [Didymodactylos carnosus]CAF3691453.1 unnamed protein product [Didymodactylos carnosus]CAF3699465.1 unnamed protein product [Didymodactylos carnosus]